MRERERGGSVAPRCALSFSFHKYTNKLVESFSRLIGSVPVIAGSINFSSWCSVFFKAYPPRAASEDGLGRLREHGG